MIKCRKIYPGSYASNCYLLSSSDGKHLALIDPSCPPSMAGKTPEGAVYDFILLTHCHFDHMIFYEEWKKFAQCLIYAGAADLDGFDNPMYNAYSFFFSGTRTFTPPDKLLYGGEQLPFGDDVICVLSTPGHTAGSLCFKIGDMLFCGDTMFEGGSYGRTDLPSGNTAELMRSLSQIKALGHGTVCYPGHGDSFIL